MVYFDHPDIYEVQLLVAFHEHMFIVSFVLRLLVMITTHDDEEARVMHSVG